MGGQSPRSGNQMTPGAAEFPEVPIIFPKRFIFDAALNVSPGRVPKSLIPPLFGHRIAWMGAEPVQPTKFSTIGVVVDHPTICPRSLIPFAELLYPTGNPCQPNHLRFPDLSQRHSSTRSRAQATGSRRGVVLAILTDYFAGIANCIDEGGWPNATEHAHAARARPARSPLIRGIKSDVTNYLFLIIHPHAMKCELTAPLWVKHVTKRWSESA